MNCEEILSMGLEEVNVSYQLIGRDTYAGVNLSFDDGFLDFVSLNYMQLLSPTRRSFYSFFKFDDDILKICKAYGKSCRSGFLGLFMYVFDYGLMVFDRVKFKYFYF